MTAQQALYKYCLRMGDNALIHSYRLSEWSSNAPFLEEDLALTNFALDFLGRAQALLSYAAQVENTGKTDDDLAYRRKERDFYNNLITELPKGDFANAMARQLFISVFEFYFFSELIHSSDGTLAAIAGKTIKEVKYHLAHAADWVVRLGDGTEESRSRIQKAVDDLWMFTDELFETDKVDEILHVNKIAVDMPPLKVKWQEHVKNVLAEATLVVPESGYMQTGSRLGIHSEYLGHILSEMQYLQRAYPDATW